MHLRGNREEGNGVKLQSAESERKVTADVPSKEKRTGISNSIVDSLWLGGVITFSNVENDTSFSDV
jgi:hypothetical protein